MEDILKENQASSEAKTTENKYRSPMNLHRELDDYGLDPYEFRVYSHVARRAGRHRVCFSKVSDMATVCKMSPRKVRYSLRFLCEAGLISEEKRQGSTTKYRLRPMEEWIDSAALEKTRQTLKSKNQK
ncbi:helix-turn-helix domain-containing protein [Adonisia turfae]|uniref:Helix-turn-helix domain-containing protein n=1 Tax=Adonisia turfae CCMR0081 TaxID=2292702 RepID=A0A6M0REP2_9CYAN|nr:helix-turn-helix domain-containing protein [Adonisia turfae]NEZ54222.1 helix-turn-helix domain-containing protein [Adonisia turfae CCMR0081]